ncbi:MAG: ABC transporter substrate-binding protein [Pseudomonadota bacterium]
MTTYSNPPHVLGVPEHFNLPWYQIADQGLITWTDVPEGTGAMLDKLSAGDAQMALLLTDGAVAGIAKGAPVRIIGCYVESPLVWGVHVAAGSDFYKPADITGRAFAISRFGSGSHLMAGVYAAARDWAHGALDYVVVDNLAGARRALPAGDADIFLWEVFTTKPYVDKGEFRRVDEIPTPWPAFVACVHRDADAATVATARDLLERALQRAAALAGNDHAREIFADRFKLEIEDAGEWLARTRWSVDGQINQIVIDRTAAALRGTGILDSEATAQLADWRAG